MDKGFFINLDDFMPSKELEGTIPWQLTSWAIQRGVTLDDLGFLPTFLLEADARKAAEQFEERYAHGGGWRTPSDPKWTLREDGTLIYDVNSEDPEVLNLTATARLRGERINFYVEGAWVAIVQPDGSFEVSRMD